MYFIPQVIAELFACPIVSIVVISSLVSPEYTRSIFLALLYSFRISLHNTRSPTSQNAYSPALAIASILLAWSHIIALFRNSRIVYLVVFTRSNNRRLPYTSSQNEVDGSKHFKLHYIFYKSISV